MRRSYRNSGFTSLLAGHQTDIRDMGLNGNNT